ncbi:MAG: DUF4276 family protein [Proteobacteria bacterium]|nr:DUF4276 family protein [Pseudomonadota bacterium]MBU4356448.1 DUF4276 family protein [Pseudomonadota bacterium]MBU4447483.1 DUF4276 family protein [Pseudomonadota bacterium]
MNSAILPIVEGQTEVESVPILLRRICVQMQAVNIQIARPYRVKRNKVVKAGELERAIEQGIRDRSNIGAILLLLDAEDDCPAALAPELSERCRQTTHLPVAVVLANIEMEGWFLGGKESLRGVCGIKPDAVAPPNPESIRGAKERLSKNMEYGRRYLEVDDQPTMATQVNSDLTQGRCPSFDKFLREVQNLIKKSQVN